MLQTNQVFNICLILVCLVVLCVSMRHNDLRCTEVVSWHLKNVSSTFNATGVLKKGSGDDKLVNTEVVKVGLVNVTTSVVTCCKGYEENYKGKCRKCQKGTFGDKCSQICHCDGFKKCNHVTGECKKCLDETCEETSPSTTDSTTLSTTYKTTSTFPSFPGDVPTSYITTTEGENNNITDLNPHLSDCDICVAANNCTEDQKCAGLTAGRNDGNNQNKDEDNTVLIAVILSLGISTIILVVGIVARERYHRLRKRRQKRAGQLPSKADVCEYVDPEPVYFEIKDEDIIVRNGHCHPQNNISYAQKIDNEYQTSVHQYNIDSQKESTEYEECGYLNPYTPLRFARSETNLFRDKKVRKNGEYDVIYSLAKSDEESNMQAERTTDEKKESETCNSSQKEEECLSDVPTYFILAKVENEAESHEIEREKLLSRKSRSSI